MRTTLTIRDDLYRRAKQAAAEAGESVGSVIEHAIEAYLTPGDASDREPAAIPAFDGFEPAPGVDFTRTSELLHDLETAP